MEHTSKAKCLDILRDIEEQIRYWDWDEDYYNSGRHSKEEWLAFAREHLNKIMDIVEKSQDFEA